MATRLIALIVAALVAVACGSSGAEGDDASEDVTPFAVVASTALSVGTGESQRVLLSVIDRDTNELLAGPDRPATVDLADENGAPIASFDSEFVWTVEGSRGVYVSYLDLPESGTYQVIIRADGLDPAGPVGLVVVDEPVVVQVGEMAKPSITRTVHDFPDLSVISSDPDPDPALYQLSVHEAVTNGTPAVVVFATPAWCISETCGPLLDQVKALAGDFPTVDFVHAEVYQDIQVASFEELETIEGVVEWGLPSEPWVFVVDEGGTVTATFEGVASDAELEAAIEAVGS